MAGSINIDAAHPPDSNNALLHDIFGFRLIRSVYQKYKEYMLDRKTDSGLRLP